jgi:hypothetical protein
LNSAGSLIASLSLPSVVRVGSTQNGFELPVDTSKLLPCNQGLVVYVAHAGHCAVNRNVIVSKPLSTANNGNGFVALAEVYPSLKRASFPILACIAGVH